MERHDSRYAATLIPGDGIGPEIVDATVAVLDALGSPFSWDRQTAGLVAHQQGGDPLPQGVIDSIARNRLALKGPLTTPIGEGFRSVNVILRRHFDLYANVRPARTLIPGGRFDNVDIVLIRENTEGLYIGFEQFIPIGGDPHAVAVLSAVNTRAGCERISEFAFDYAVKNGRRRLTIVHKANIMKVLTGLFLEEALLIAERYKDRVEVEDRIIDACAMQLVLDPTRFDMIVTTNMFGDILSDEIAGLVGGLGMAPGANIGKEVAMFEAVHGSAPDIAGKGVANPIALILAAAMMLDHVGEQQTARRLRQAIDDVLKKDGIRTRDLGGSATTADVTRAIVDRLRA
jgi:isocitrate dehydrogenase (NAD+)